MPPEEVLKCGSACAVHKVSDAKGEPLGQVQEVSWAGRIHAASEEQQDKAVLEGPCQQLLLVERGHLHSQSKGLFSPPLLG